MKAAFLNFSRITSRFTGLLALGVLLSSCMLMDESGVSSNSSTGYVRFELELKRNPKALMKSAMADTTFSLDSLLIVLSAPSTTPITYRYALTGRADSGDIVVSAKTLTLPGLRQWKATFISIDTNEALMRRDTVHLDSVTFRVGLLDTTLVNKIVSPAYSILRVRFLSNSPDSVTVPVRYVRLRVNGVKRDSALIGGRDASLNWLQAMSGTTLHAAGDSGRVLMSTDDGANWSEENLGTRPMVGGHFPSASIGFVVSDIGKMYRTEDGGDSWQERAQIPLNNSVRDTVSAIYFPSTSYGFVIGKNGAIHKTMDGWQSWKLESNTTFDLNGMHFPDETTGFIVGENETILKTKNAEAAGGSSPENGGIVWAPVAGGWFNQTSATPNNLAGIQFTDVDRGWAIGDDAVRLTTNGGATWLERGGLGSSVNAFQFNTATKGYAVGNGGDLYQQDGNEWYWAPRTSGTSEHLYDVKIIGADTLYLAGANGTLMRSTNSSTTNWPYITLVQQALPPVQSWLDRVSGISDTIQAVGFASAAAGWAVANGGRILKTTDAGATWTAQINDRTRPLRDLHVISSSNVVAVGDSGIVKRTTNGGTNWTTVASGVTTTLNGVAFTGSSIGWAVGASNVIRRTSNGGANWTNRTGGSGTFNAVTTSSSRAWIVGNGGVIYRSSALTYNATVASVNNGAIGSQNLYGVYFVSADVGYIVGANGLIAKATDGNTGWVVKTSGTTETLVSVKFSTTDTATGYVVGANGTILRTTNGGTTWTSQTSGTSQPLKGVAMLGSDTAIAVGAAGKIIRTLNGGSTTNKTTLRSIFPVTSSLVYVAGANGSILKTTNAGASWSSQTTGTSEDLYSVYFSNASKGYAVGNTGTILKTTNGGTNWSTLSSGTTRDLRSVRFVTPDTGYATGLSGIMLKTNNGGASWYVQETPTTVRMNQIYAYNQGLVFAVGDSGKILKAVNEGNNWTGGGTKKSLKGVYFPTLDTGYIVGVEGTILKTTNGGDFWTKQTSGVTGTLYGVYFTDKLTGWVSGEGGKVLKTTNGGINWVSQNSGSAVTLRWANFRTSSRGFLIGGTQSLVNTTNGGTNWGSQFVGAPGARTFDELLGYKYLKPNQSHTILMQAIDQESPLRGFQATKTVLVGAGQDSTIMSPMSRCGYGGVTPACTP